MKNRVSSCLCLVAATFIMGCSSADSSTNDQGGSSSSGSSGSSGSSSGGTEPTEDGGGSPDGGKTPDGSPSKVDGSVPHPPLSGNVDPNCIDGKYDETMPDPSAGISDVPFNASAIGAYFQAVLNRRYPTGAELVKGGEMNTSAVGDCAVYFSSNAKSATAANQTLSTVVHECGHLDDARLGGGFGENAYYFTSATQFTCSHGDTTSRGGDTFERSRIYADTYAASHPPCNASGNAPHCDMYADVYLDGNPDDNIFQSGDQGFNMVLEEAVQYVNSLVSAWAFLDQRPPGQMTSDRDGILTFLWYIERYLHLARTSYPSAYATLSGDSCWQKAILTLWGRAWIYLDATKSINGLSIDGSLIEPLVLTPDLLDEIARLRTAAGCK
jgi:hypothetical protein